MNGLVLRIALLVLLGSVLPASASTESRCAQLTNVIKCENFDDGTPTGGWPHTPSSSWIGSSGTGPNWVTSNYAEGATASDLTTTPPCGARGRSLHISNPASGIGFVDDQLLAISPAVTEIRIRANICAYDSFDTNFSPAGAEDGMHFLFIDTALSLTGARFDLFSYGNNTGGATNPSITYAGTEYIQTHPYGPECGQTSGARGFFNFGNPSATMGTFLSVDYNRGDHQIGGTGAGPVAPSLCKNIHTVSRSGGSPRWFTVEFGYKILPVGTSFTCSVTCPSRIALVQIIVDGTSVLTDWPVGVDPTYDTIYQLIFSGFMSTAAGDIDFAWDDIIITSNYSTVIGAVSSASIPSLSIPGGTRFSGSVRLIDFEESDGVGVSY